MWPPLSLNTCSRIPPLQSSPPVLHPNAYLPVWTVQDSWTNLLTVSLAPPPTRALWVQLLERCASHPAWNVSRASTCPAFKAHWLSLQGAHLQRPPLHDHLCHTVQAWSPFHCILQPTRFFNRSISGSWHRYIKFSKIPKHTCIWHGATGKQQQSYKREPGMRQTPESRLVLLQIWLTFQETHLKNRNLTVTQFSLYVKWKQTSGSEVQLFLVLSKERHFSWGLLHCFVRWMPSLTSWQCPSDEVVGKPSPPDTQIEFINSSFTDAEQWDSGRVLDWAPGG